MRSDSSTDAVTEWLRVRMDAMTEGEQLPSMREVQRLLHVSPLTIRKALCELAAHGLIDTRPGRGTFVRHARQPAFDPGDGAWQIAVLGAARIDSSALADLASPPSPGILPLSSGYLPSDLQATGLLLAAMSRAARRPAVWDRMPLDGLEALRNWFARELHPSVTASDVIICPGSQPAIATTFRALTQPGDPILMESPTYLGALTAARSAGLRIIPVATDEFGVRPDALREALRETGAKVFYSQPTFSNPSGTVLAPARRPLTYEAVRAAGAFLIEDDYARDLGFEGTPPPPLATLDRSGHVIYIRSLTKPSAPGLRIGALIARGAARMRLRSCRSGDDLYVAGPLQEAALQLVTAPSWPRHLRSLQRALLERRDVLVEAVRRAFGPVALFTLPRGGFHLWVRLPDRTSTTDARTAAERSGVLVSAGHQWFPADPPAPFLRLTFAAAPPEVLRRATSLLAKAILSEPALRT